MSHTWILVRLRASAGDATTTRQLEIRLLGFAIITTKPVNIFSDGPLRRTTRLFEMQYDKVMPTLNALAESPSLLLSQPLRCVMFPVDFYVGFPPTNFDDQSPGQGRLEVHGGKDQRGQGDSSQGQEIGDGSGERKLHGCQMFGPPCLLGHLVVANRHPVTAFGGEHGGNNRFVSHHLFVQLRVRETGAPQFYVGNNRVSLLVRRLSGGVVLPRYHRDESSMDVILRC